MMSYSLSEKANALSVKIDTIQTSLLKGLPKGAAKDVVTGVTNLPEMVVSTVGNIPLGLESMARNPSTISDSIALGTGALAGATVQKAKTHPGELAGEIVGAALLSKGAGKIDPASFNKQSLGSFVRNEKATVGLKQMYVEGKYSSIPETKIKTVDLSEKTHSISQASIGEDVKLTAEMEEVLFRKGPANELLSEVETRNIFSHDLTRPSKYHISSIQEAETNQISRVSIGEDVKLTAEMEEVLFRKGPANELLSEVETRNIFSYELTQPSKYHISSIQEAETKISRVSIGEDLKLPSGSLKESNQKVYVPSYKPKSIPTISAIIDTIPIVGQKITLVQNNPTSIDSITSTKTKTKTDNVQIQDQTTIQIPELKIKQTSIQDTIPDTINDIIPDISPNIPTPPPDPFPNNTPDISPDIPTPTDPFDLIIIPPTPNTIISIGGGDFDALKGFSFDAPKHKKTKKKMLKNVYGDPFSENIKL